MDGDSKKKAALAAGALPAKGVAPGEERDGRPDGSDRSISDALERSQAVFVFADPTGRVTFANAQARTALGVAPGDDLRPALGRLDPELARSLAHGLGAAKVGPAIVLNEEPVCIRVMEFLDEGGLLALLPRDAKDALPAQTEHQERFLLLGELNHRMKNLFSVISGLIELTARSVTTTERMASVLRGRIASLTAAHNLLAPAIDGEEGVTSRVPLGELVDGCLSPFVGHGDTSSDKLTVEGPVIQTGPQATTALSLTIHELATNAVKHGGLSTDEGRMHVSWSIHHRILRLRWVERNIKGPPSARSLGFGTQLIRMCVEIQLAGKLDYRFEGGDLIVEMAIPIERIGR